jgi:hypothetical protein
MAGGRVRALSTGLASLGRAGRLTRVRSISPSDRELAAELPRRRSAGFVVIRHAVRLDPWPMYEDGVPICGVPRAIADTAVECFRLREVRAMVAEAVQSRLCQPED